MRLSTIAEHTRPSTRPQRSRVPPYHGDLSVLDSIASGNYTAGRQPDRDRQSARGWRTLVPEETHVRSRSTRPTDHRRGRTLCDRRGFLLRLARWRWSDLQEIRGTIRHRRRYD